MAEQVDLATSRLFDKDALAASNIKMCPGTNREIGAEQLAEQINKALQQIQVGDYELVDVAALDM